MTSREESLEEDARWIREILSASGGPSREREEGFRKLLHKYWKLVAVLAAGKLGDRREAEDVTQEAFFRAFRSLANLSEPAAFLGWLLRIARNLSTDRLRSRRSTVSLEALGDSVTFAAWDARRSAPSDLEQSIEREEETAQVMEALRDLPEKYQEVVALKYLRGLDGKAMASLLGEPEGTVRNRLFRALEKLRARLEQKRAQKP